MLPSTLRATRGLGQRQLCLSSCGRVTGAGPHRVLGRSTTVASSSRSYAKKTDNKNGDESATSESKPEKEDSEKGNGNGNGNKSSSSSNNKNKSAEKKAKASSKQNKQPSATQDAIDSIASKLTNPALKSTSADPETLEALKKTLEILKEVQSDPSVYEELATAGRSGKSSKKATDKAKKAIRSLREQFPSISDAATKTEDQRQKKLLSGVANVLKTVLAHSGKAPPSSSPEKAEEKETQTQSGEQEQSAQKKATQEEPQETATTTTAPDAVVDQDVIKGIATIVTKTKVKRKAAEPASTTASETAKASAKAAKTKKSSKKTKEQDKEEKDDPKSTEKRTARARGPVKVEKFETVPTSSFTPIEHEKPPVPLIQYGLDRVLFNEGVMVLQDPRSKVWNFDPYLANIMQPSQFDFEALSEYITSSKDSTLLGITKKHGKKYTGSTSSMTSTLAHFHYLLSAWRPINPARLTKDFDPEYETFNSVLRAPAGTFLNYNDGVYAIDADKEWDIDSILSMLGKSMEKLLTVPKEEFEKYRRENSHQLTAEQKDQPESYHYTAFGDFMMRSQLDAYDPRLPGTGVYDLKTRAVVSVRLDAANHEKGRDYEIRSRTGQWESYEREYFDLIRSAFLKYSMQVRMGRMDGIFVAYHNTQRIFGFQYIPIEEMDLAIHGQLDVTLGEKEFTASLTLLNKLLNEATARFPGQSLRIFVETRNSESQNPKTIPFTYFFAEPVTPEDIAKIQVQSKEDVERFRERVLGIAPPEAQPADAEADATTTSSSEEVATTTEEAAVEEAQEEEDSDEVWEDIMEVVEQTMDKDAQGLTAVRDAIQEALEQSGLLHAKSPEEAQRYIDSLLNSIVDVNEPAAEGEEDGATTKTESPEGEETLSQKFSSPFSFLSSWFSSSPSATDKPAPPAPSAQAETAADKPAAEPEQQEQQQIQPQQQQQQIPDPTLQDKKSETAASEGSTTVAQTAGDADDAVLKETETTSQQANLVELIVKLASMVAESAPSPLRASGDEKEDQAKLRAFERVLLEMMPAAEEAAAQDNDKKTTASSSSSSPPPAEEKEPEPPKKDLIAMVLTVRNVVNGKHVKRPEHLTQKDKWAIEYSIEEIADAQKAQLLYEQVKKRRKNALVRAPGSNVFRTAFDGVLPRLTRNGQDFRRKEKEVQNKLPVWVVGQPEPFHPKDVFSGSGLNLENAMPNVDASKTFMKKTTKKQDDASESKDSEPAPSTSSFKEWREKAPADTKE